MLHSKSPLSPYRLASSIRLVFWIMCLTLGGIGLHLAPTSPEHPVELTQMDQSDFMAHFSALPASDSPKE